MGLLMTIIKVIFAFLLPPIAVLLERGITPDLLINIGLTILGWIPGKEALFLFLSLKFLFSIEFPILEFPQSFLFWNFRMNFVKILFFWNFP